MIEFQVYPALDLKDGNCVRLLFGDANKETIYERDPTKQVEFFISKGFSWIHIVDLNAAFDNLDNKKLILKIVQKFKTKINIQLGGGIRTIDDIKFWIDSGVSRVVLGTFAFKNPDLINNLSNYFIKKLALGLDIKKNKIAINGWTKLLNIDPIKYINQIDQKYFNKVIYTDISRDGSLEGVNIEQTKNFVKSIQIPIIASGGISNLNNVQDLYNERDLGISGVIIGKAIYENKININDLTKFSWN
tara:strand:+ start:3896 stop:4633 length:738 start_codon:yes stop_codon:yes gene_type:complete